MQTGRTRLSLPVIRRTNGVWALRFRAYGRRQYQTLGSAEEGWDRQKAEQELEPTVDVNPNPTFQRFASEWFEATKGEWRDKTRLDYEWQLTSHLLPFFRDHRPSQITVREIDRYRQEKVAEGRRSQPLPPLANH